MLLMAWTLCGATGNEHLQFIGSTPGDSLPREFLGGLPANAPCHCIMWELTLFTNRTYDIAARYQVPARGNTNQSEDGPKVTAKGTWEIGEAAKPHGSYRLRSQQTRQILSLAKIGDNLLHVLNSDGTLMVGNGGWSYTLNRADLAEKPGDVSRAADMSYKISPLATGPNVFGVFEGRSPGHGIASDLKIPRHEGRIKVKWRVTLYQDPVTSAPTTYKVEGSLHRRGAREGTWTIGHGAKTNPNAIVYQLAATPTESALLLLKADDNVLFFLDQNRKSMVGHAEFSYTLNRVARK